MAQAPDPSLQDDWKEVSIQTRHRRDVVVDEFLPKDFKLPGKDETNVIHYPRKFLSKEELEITESTIEQLLQSLATGSLTAVTVVRAFLKRAAIAQKLTNCVYELLPERALVRAQHLDDLYVKEGTLGRPLHGLPISVKSQVGVKDTVNAGGFIGFIDNINPIDSFQIQALEAAGAIAFVKTTESQGAFTLECSNNLTGATTNPHNTNLSSGGSSGGEGALQALRGSLLGIGGDIGGSIRCPAVNCGIYGLRTTTFRLPMIGAFSWLAGLENIWSILGPMSTSLEGIELYMKAVLDRKPWVNDLSLHQIPWRKVETPRVLTVGVIWDDGIVKPSPPVLRALDEVVEKLRKDPQGRFRVVDWVPYNINEAIEILKRLYSPDGGEAFQRALDKSGEPWDPLAKYVLKDQSGVQVLKHYEEWEWVMKRELYRYYFLQDWNTRAPEVDVILSPVCPHPAPPHGTSRYWGYTSLWNLLDYPAIAFPVTQVDAKLDSKDGSYTPRNEMDQWYYDRYDIHEQAGVPVGLQVIAKRMEDEKVVQALRLMKESINLPFVDCLQK